MNISPFNQILVSVVVVRSGWLAGGALGHQWFSLRHGCGLGGVDRLLVLRRLRVHARCHHSAEEGRTHPQEHAEHAARAPPVNGNFFVSHRAARMV